MKNLRTFFLLFCSIFVSAQAVTLQAASFTADAVQIRGENISHAKMYWLDGNVRFEYAEDDVPMVQIFDNKNNRIIWLDTENKYFWNVRCQKMKSLSPVKRARKTPTPVSSLLVPSVFF